MVYLKKNKKAIEAAGFGIIIGIIVLLLSAGIIIWVIKNSAGKADEKLQVDLCRISNEIKLGVEERTPAWNPVSTPRICSTIDKYSKEKLQVPTGGYEQNKEGAEEEIRDMIKNCWYMWLEGSEKNMFEKMPLGQGCYVCYIFQIEDEIEDDVTFNSISASMSKPYFARDVSDKCAPIGGFYDNKIPTDCGTGWEEIPSKKAVSEGKKCFVKEGGIMNECENKGGCCFETATEGYIEKYTKWSCPEGECYIKEDNIYSYTDYITRYTPRGGDVYFLPKQDVNYASQEKYAISFVSPSEQLCLTHGGGTGCYLAVGAYAIGIVAVVTGAVVLAPIAAPVIGSVASAAGSAAVSSVGAFGVNGVLLGGGAAVATGAAGYGAYKLGFFNKALAMAAEFVLSGITVEVPDLIIVSTLGDAQQLGCVIE